MVCTFGDATDVEWWREQQLALRQIVQRDGRLAPVEFGSAGCESLDPDRRATATTPSSPARTSRRRASASVELLREPAGSATGSGAPLRGEPKHDRARGQVLREGRAPARVRADAPVVRAPAARTSEALLAKGARDRLAPALHAEALRGLDGEPEPGLVRLAASATSACRSRSGTRSTRRASATTTQPILPDAAALPVDPTTDVPPGYTAAQREQPGGFSAETDIFDTWFTSSLTPQISSHWTLDAARHAALFPADVRPQAPRHHPHLGVLHDREGAAARGHGAVAARA